METPVAIGLDYPHHRSDGEVVTSAIQVANLPSCDVANGVVYIQSYTSWHSSGSNYIGVDIQFYVYPLVTGQFLIPHPNMSLFEMYAKCSVPVLG
jgi:hypothetical protein